MDLRAWFLPFNNHLTTSSRRDLETQWIHFTHAFSGLVCSSLPSAIRESRSMTYPRWTFSDRFHGVHFNTSRRSVQHVHMALARESVCTENLTPWMKWIPGHAQHGVSSTLDAYKVLDSNYHSIQLHVDLKCSSPLKCKQILTLNLVVVFSVPRVLNLPQFGKGGFIFYLFI
ncbi:Subunit of the glycosylphosphatidylinositol transamidase complex-like protein [Coelomomyces lativittatus]|nr:Subunit of the glycosylphosphatidylinositol transamidase complex-like protein [Coelomomyces lativittatus]KAJ1497192.1 Subunit of the glycosylphosphatidylinositol transamidase complex-like protein [Coelomomyces lativittatus]